MNLFLNYSLYKSRVVDLWQLYSTNKKTNRFHKNTNTKEYLLDSFKRNTTALYSI